MEIKKYTLDEIKNRKSLYYDRKGNPIDVMQWANLFESDYRIVKYDVVEGYDISTIWLGVDHRFYFDERQPKPIIFETMVFSEEKELDFKFTERYSTEEEAVEGHAHKISQIRSWKLD